MMEEKKRKTKWSKKKEENFSSIHASLSMKTTERIFMWCENMKYSICIITVAGETRVAWVRLGVESSMFKFDLCSPCCCCEEDAPTEVDAVVDDDEEELEAPCCPWIKATSFARKDKNKKNSITAQIFELFVKIFLSASFSITYKNCFQSNFEENKWGEEVGGT